MNLPVPQTNQLPADPAQLADYYRQQAEAYASEERRAGSSISVRNGHMSIGDQNIPGDQFAAILLDSVRLNTFYSTAFNAQNIAAPVCYAIGRSDAEMAPHPDMAKDQNYFQPQADRCGACPHNVFGSGRSGAGKACSNRRRVMLLLAGTYQNGQLQAFTDPAHYASAPILTLTLPPTTIQSWGQFVRDTATQYQRPMFGVVARVFLYAHPKHGKEAVGFETLAPVPDDWAPTIIQRHQEAAREIMDGYDPPMNMQRGGGFYQAQNQIQGQR